MKHEQYDTILAWAEGEKIQFFDDGQWIDMQHKPSWDIGNQYRIKPSLLENTTLRPDMITMPMLTSLWERGLFFSGMEKAIDEQSPDIPQELCEAYTEYKQADDKLQVVISKYFRDNT